MNTDPLHMRLSDLPLWRLLVALDDAERTAGPESPTARALARAVLKKLRREPPEPDQMGGVRHVG